MELIRFVTKILAMLLLYLFSYCPLLFLFFTWLSCQIILHLWFDSQYPKHDVSGIKSLVVAHNVYRSIMCFLFFVCGVYIWNTSIKTLQLDSLHDEQMGLLIISGYYMIGDLIFAVLSHHVSRIRIDLMVHHLIGLFYILLCWYSRILYPWSFVCVTELLSVWTGLGSYATYMNYYGLQEFCYLARIATILFWRIPWWITAISYLNIFSWAIVKLILVSGITTILAMDLYWLHKCIIGIKALSNKK